MNRPNIWSGDNAGGVGYIEYDGRHHHIYGNNDSLLSVNIPHEVESE